MTDGLSGTGGDAAGGSDFWAKFAAVVDELDQGVRSDDDVDPWADVQLDPSGLTLAQRQVLEDQPDHPRLSQGFPAAEDDKSETGNAPGDGD
jgi:hypothetical protein